MLKNVTVSNLFGSLPEEYVRDEFERGLKRNYNLWALASLDELIRRGQSGFIVCALESAFDKCQILEGSSLLVSLAETLKEDCEGDKYLRSYGASLLNGEFLSPSAWAEKRSKELDAGHDPAAAREIRFWIRICHRDHNLSCESDMLDDLNMEQCELH
ncbi:hypothetical protein J6X73_02580 [Candidatus Saccharibacteria bacterium]|nr:hypothetical protein [Candidatus Saccharibacteria bacterium]